MDECIAQASGAASRMLTVISKDKLISEGITAVSNPDRCDGCGVCVGCCDYNAITLVEQPDGGLKSYVNPGLATSTPVCARDADAVSRPVPPVRWSREDSGASRSSPRSTHASTTPLEESDSQWQISNPES